jgi:hypothetical protein
MGLQMEQELWIESEWAEGLWCLDMQSVAGSTRHSRGFRWVS